MLERMCSNCGREHEELTVSFDGKLRKMHFANVSNLEKKLNEEFSSFLNGELILHAEGDVVDGFTYITDDLTEVRDAVFISRYIREEITSFKV